MKRGILIILIVIAACGIASAQKADKSVIKNMLQGLWKLKGNDSVTIAIAGDSALEYKLGTEDMGVFSCTLSKQSCDNQVFVASPTGYYLTLGADEEDALCGALQLINNKEFRLLLDENSLIIFEKME